MIIHAYVYPQSLACIITFARAQNFPHSDEQMRQELHLAASISAWPRFAQNKEGYVTFQLL